MISWFFGDNASQKWNEKLLVFVAGGNVRLWLAPVDSWISHGPVGRLHAQFGADTEAQAVLAALLHLFPDLQILCDRVVAVNRVLLLLALLLHQRGVRVVRECFALADHLLAVVGERLEVVGGAWKDVPRDAKKLHVLFYHLKQIYVTAIFIVGDFITLAFALSLR